MISERVGAPRYLPGGRRPGRITGSRPDRLPSASGAGRGGDTEGQFQRRFALLHTSATFSHREVTR